MDEAMRKMVSEAYDETVSEAMAQGHSPDTAHKEGITAAAMFLSSMSGLEDAAARGAVEALGLEPT
ncbi:hypothetical protein GALL_304490 [mine drainage metagenome]|uniref:Uncharacterized protein n=1 Tax=mine drainage metagenome TaxID=410659 RepID=A0A1J5R6K5_9ZZZZ